MSHPGPIVLVSSALQSRVTETLSEAGLSPVLEAGWRDALDSVQQLQPAAVIVAASDQDHHLPELARRVASCEPYVPLIVVEPRDTLPSTAIAFNPIDGRYQRLVPRLKAALRVRSLHDTVLRRIGNDLTLRTSLQATDPRTDATVLLLGRGGGYAALSVALGERVGVVGTLSIEGAAKHLNSRELDGIVLGDGFSPRVVEAFLTVMAEDSRFRHLPIIVTVPGATVASELPNMEIALGDPECIAADALALFRQHAFAARLNRTLQSLDQGGLIDPRTGLLTPSAFERDFATAVYQTQARGGGLSVARFTFEHKELRVRTDAALIASRLMRRMDFGTLQDDGSLLLVLIGADQRSAQSITRRLASVMKQTSHGTRREARIDPDIAIASLAPGDSAKSLLARLQPPPERAVAAG